MKPNLKFKALRSSKNLSQVEFAAILGVSQGTIGDIERGRIGISKNIRSKIIEKFQIEAGYFDNNNNVENIEFKQGDETGGRQGFNQKYLDDTLKRIFKEKRNIKEVDAANLSDQDILLYLSGKNEDYKLINVSDERSKTLHKLLEKQKVIAEKVINSLTIENPVYSTFRNDILAIQSFENVMDNIINCTEINELIKIGDSARRYPMIQFSDFKNTLNDDFSKLEPYISIFSDLANAMQTFAERASQIPSQITGIDEQEFTEYLALNKKNTA